MATTNKKAGAAKTQLEDSKTMSRKNPGRDLKALRQELGMTRQIMARLVGMSIRKVAKIESEDIADPSTRRRLVEIHQLLRALGTIMREEFVTEWIQEPNEGFKDLSPLEVIERGQVDRIWQMIFSISHGDAL